MRAHCNFLVRFCNPASGHEKGNVETKVGYDRNNLFVPVPAYEDIEAYNRELLGKHEIKARETHYKKLVPIHQLFEDVYFVKKKSLFGLPKILYFALPFTET